MFTLKYHNRFMLSNVVCKHFKLILHKFKKWVIKFSLFLNAKKQVTKQTLTSRLMSYDNCNKITLLNVKKTLLCDGCSTNQKMFYKLQFTKNDLFDVLIDSFPDCSGDSWQHFGLRGHRYRSKSPKTFAPLLCFNGDRR